jgi:VWFA-related protein
MRALSRLTTYLLVAGTATAGLAQQPVPPVEAELVELDAVVTDSQGRLVRDLKREDFQVFEDGKPQRLVHFLPVEAAGAPAPGATPLPEGKPSRAGAPAPDAQEARGPGRQIVILVDDLHIAAGDLEFTQRALLRFVEEFAAADDRMALVTTSAVGGMRQLSLDRGALKQAIAALVQNEARVAPARGSRITPAQAELILRGDTNALALATRALVTEPGSVLDPQANSPQAALAELGVGPRGMGSALSGAANQAAEQEARRQARGILNEALRFSMISLSAIEGVLRSLATLPGRKVCLLVSDGFLYGAGTSEERIRDLRSVIDAATRSGAVVYSLDPRGLTTGSSDASVAGSAVPPGLQERVDRGGELLQQETLMALANDTGGFLVRATNDLASGLQRMLEDNQAYYLMAYEPSNQKRDGRFRKIEVKLAQRSGYSVRTRRGYFAPDDSQKEKRASAAPTPGPPAAPGPPTPPLAPATPLFDAAAARGMLGGSLPAEGGIPVRLSVDYLDLPPQGSRAIVQAHVDLARLDWEQAEGRQRASLDLVGSVYDASGKPVGEPFGRRAEFDLSPAEHTRALQEGLRYQHELPLGAGRYEVRMLAREAKHGGLGGAARSLVVPDLAAGQFAISSVFLSSSATGGTAGAETVQDAHALRRFKRSDSLVFQLYIYNPVKDDAGSDVVLQAQILSGGKPIAASKALPAALATKDGVPVPETNGMALASLEPGGYQLRVVVVDRKSKVTLNGSVDFSVE